MRAVPAAKGIASRIHICLRHKYLFMVVKLIVRSRSFWAAKPIVRNWFSGFLAVRNIHPFRSNRAQFFLPQGHRLRTVLPEVLETRFLQCRNRIVQTPSPSGYFLG